MTSAGKRTVTRRRKKRILIGVIVVLVVAAIAAVILFLWRNRKVTPVDVFPVANVYQTYWGDTLSFQGQVTSGTVQNVPLQSGLVQSVDVVEGAVVNEGDVLMTYDTTSLQLTLQADAARIAVLESKLDTAQKTLATYKTLKPSESAPAPTLITVPGTETAPVTLDIVNSADAPTAGDGSEESPFEYACKQTTVVTAEMLQWLRDNGYVAMFNMYDDIALMGSWLVDGLLLPETLEDWTLDAGITLIGDGTATVDFSVPHYGSLTTCVPNYDDGSYSYYQDNYTVDSKGNYAYSKAELAKMVAEMQATITSTELDLKGARLTYEKDQLVSETGQVTAAISGVVTRAADPTTLNEGETVVSVKGEANYVVTIYVGEMNLEKIAVGDTIEVNSYESSSYFTATVTEIGTTAEEDSYMNGDENPNSSYYPVTAVVDDPDVALSMGEWCSASLLSTDESESGVYLPNSLVRSDGSGSYIMVADENDQLIKRYVQTGKTLWGYQIEIKSGLSIDDRIAFPYGTNVKEGAPVQDSDDYMY